MKLSAKDQAFLVQHRASKKDVTVYSENSLTEKLHSKSLSDAKSEARKFLRTDKLDKRLKR